jgi:hypothetical protein
MPNVDMQPNDEELLRLKEQIAAVYEAMRGLWEQLPTVSGDARSQLFVEISRNAQELASLYTQLDTLLMR